MKPKFEVPKEKLIDLEKLKQKASSTDMSSILPMR